MEENFKYTASKNYKNGGKKSVKNCKSGVQHVIEYNNIKFAI